MKDTFFIGLILAIIGFIIMSLSFSPNSKSKFAVGGIIGFIPFGFGNDKRLVISMIIFSAVLFIIFLLLMVRK